MSTFRQLMLGKRNRIKHYMNLDIVGSPTISNGVVSGFSANNYLAINRTFSLDNNIIEFVFDVFLPNNNTAQNACFLAIPTNTRMQFYRLSVDLNYFVINIAGQSSSGTHQYSLNTSHKIKVVITKTTISLYYYDNNQWILDISYNITNNINSATRIGCSKTGDRYFYGSININNSYIKINNTKYNYQFTMPLTKVGSPTITDGVVSGFSSSDYLSLSINPNLSAETEIVTKINRNANNNSQFIIAWKSDNVYSVGLYLSAGKIITNYQRSADGSNQRLLLGTKVYDTNTDYYIKLIKTNNSLSLFYSINGNFWEQDAIAEFAEMPSFAVSRFRIGVGADTTPNAPFDGSIDINNTYIIIDGIKYIFTLP